MGDGGGKKSGDGGGKKSGDARTRGLICHREPGDRGDPRRSGGGGPGMESVDDVDRVRFKVGTAKSPFE